MIEFYETIFENFASTLEDTTMVVHFEILQSNR